MRKACFLALLVLCSGFISAAFSQMISGEVYDKATHDPIAGATVITIPGNRGTTTSADGKFTIELKGDRSIEVSYTGYKSHKVILTNSATYSIELEASSLDQVVVVGYGTQKKANLTGAVTSVDVKKTFESRPMADVSRSLQGVVPGLTITTATGDLGTNPKIRLRGLYGSINTGANGAKPLILVDNVEIPSLQMIDPNDIETISVLKDAASASIYGTRGAFGVILITTKSGKKGSPARVTYNNNFAWSKSINTVKFAPAADNAEVSLQAKRRANPVLTDMQVVGDIFIDPLAIEKMREWEEKYSGQDLGNDMEHGRDFELRNGHVYFYRPWDPGKMYMKDWTLQQRHNIGVSGGSEKTTYNLNLGYIGQEGVLKVNPDKFSRYNFTLGVNTAATSWLDVRGKIIYSNTRNETPFIFSGVQYGPWYYLYRWPAFYPYGTYEGKPFRNAVTEVEQAKMDQYKTGLTRISVGGTIKPLKGLTIDADYTFTSTNEHLNQTGGGTTAWDWTLTSIDKKLNYWNYQGTSYNKATWYSYWNEINTGKAFATYSQSIGDHAFKAIAGGDIELYRNNSQTSERSNLIDPNYGSIELTTGTPLVAGNNGHWATLGFFGRINYAFQNKYLLELNGRYDGSSRFPVNRLWGFFPSMSVGYVLTEESFMKATQPYLSFLKLRASYGSVGNQAVGTYRFLSLMDANVSNWLLPSGNAIYMGEPTAYSPDLTWETVKTIDVGVDARFLDNKLGVSFDWFNRTTSDMISPGASLPASYGTNAPHRNFGELQGKGWELALDFSHTLPNGIHFTVTGTLSDAVEKITKFANRTKTLPAAITAMNEKYYEGMTIGEIWGYETDRLFQESDFDGQTGGRWRYKSDVAPQTSLENSSFFFGPGDVKYKNLNGDSVISQGSNTVDDPGDKKIIGNSTPRYQYGFRIDADWKGFDVGIFIQGVAKRDLWASGPIIFPGFRAAEAWFAHQMDYWTPDNTGAFYPRPADYSATVEKWNFHPQTRYLLNLAYLRVKNVSVGYALPKSVISKARLQRARIYVSAENLITFDKLGDVPIDPEIDFTQSQIDKDRAGFGRAYPYRTTISAGLQVTF